MNPIESSNSEKRPKPPKPVKPIKNLNYEQSPVISQQNPIGQHVNTQSEKNPTSPTIVNHKKPVKPVKKNMNLTSPPLSQQPSQVEEKPATQEQAEPDENIPMKVHKKPIKQKPKLQLTVKKPKQIQITKHLEGSVEVDVSDYESDFEDEIDFQLQQKLIKQFLKSDPGRVFQIRNCCIVQIQQFAPEYPLWNKMVYMLTDVVGDELIVKVLSVKNAKDSLFAIQLAKQYVDIRKDQFMQTTVIPQGFEGFDEVDDELECQDVKDPQAQCSTITFEAFQLPTQPIKRKIQKDISVVQIYKGQITRLKMELSQILPFFDFKNPFEKYIGQRDYYWNGILIVFINQKFCFQFFSQKKVQHKTKRFLIEITPPSSQDRALASYYVKSLNVIEQNLAMFDIQDLQQIYSFGRDPSTQVTSKQKQFINLIQAQKYHLASKYPFDTERFLIYLNEKDQDLCETFLQHAETSYILIQDAPKQVMNLKFADLNEFSACFVISAQVYNWVGRRCSQATKNFCEAQRKKYEATVIEQSTELGDFLCLFEDFTHNKQLIDQELEKHKMKLAELDTEVKVTGMSVQLDFDSQLAQTDLETVQDELKFHISTDQQLESSDVLNQYDQLLNGQKVVNLCSTLAQLFCFYNKQNPKPFRVFVWKGQHCLNRQVFQTGSKFWVGPEAQKLREMKQIQTSTEESFSEGEDFLKHFDVFVYHLGQFKKFKYNMQSWNIQCPVKLQKRNHRRFFLVQNHFQFANKIVCQEQMHFDSFLNLDALSALLIIDYKDDVIYYKFGQQCVENVKQFVLNSSQSCFGTPKFKVYSVDEKHSKVNKITQINELQFDQKQNFGIFVVERQQYHVKTRQVLVYQNIGRSLLHVIRHPAMQLVVVAPFGFTDDLLFNLVLSQLTLKGVQFITCDLRDQLKLSQSLSTMQVAIQWFSGLRMVYKEPEVSQAGLYYSSCHRMYTDQIEMLATKFNNGEEVGKQYLDLNGKFKNNFYKDHKTKNVLLNQYVEAYCKKKEKDSNKNDVGLAEIIIPGEPKEPEEK
uniref:Uncharacterized protein n=1 Tax=Trepomonas sp. PC1 TaxID=1076344 RepID=A0A146K497_9EUKA|eukprot:JAP90476.1 Hypothetical protein TPC1_30029 [Trepomonas sp. PC1]